MIASNPVIADEIASCTTGVILAIYADATQLHYAIKTITSRPREVHFATGTSWSVTCFDDETLCSELAGELGGEYQQFPAE